MTRERFMPLDSNVPDEDRIRCVHMLDAAREAMQFIQNRKREDLDADHMLRRALKDCIQEIGEAAARVTDDGRARFPEMPWPKMVGMRHILVHAYFEIDWDTIWRVARDDLPALIQLLEKSLNVVNDSEPDES